MARSYILASAFVVCISLLFKISSQQQLLPSLPPRPQPNQKQQQLLPQLNQYNGYSEQKKQEKLLPGPKKTQQQPQVIPINLQAPVQQNGRIPNRRVDPAMISDAAAGLKWNQSKTQDNGVDLIEEFLYAHNEARRQYNVEPYSWDTNLERYAREWGLKRSLDCKMVHSYGPYGENLFWGFQEHWTNGEAVKNWVEENQFYDSNQNSCAPQKVCGHFTQVVWKDSTRVGCARQKCINGSLLVICEYDPPGNFLHEHPFKNNI